MEFFRSSFQRSLKRSRYLPQSHYHQVHRPPKCLGRWCIHGDDFHECGLLKLFPMTDPCMVYTPTYGLFLMVNVGKYTIHGSLLMFKLNPLTSFKKILFDVPYTSIHKVGWKCSIKDIPTLGTLSPTLPPQKGLGGLTIG